MSQGSACLPHTASHAAAPSPSVHPMADCCALKAVLSPLLVSVEPMAVCAPPAVAPNFIVALYGGNTPTEVCSAVHSSPASLSVATRRNAFSGLAPLAKMPFSVALAEQMHSWPTVKLSV